MWKRSGKLPREGCVNNHAKFSSALSRSLSFPPRPAAEPIGPGVHQRGGAGHSETARSLGNSGDPRRCAGFERPRRHGRRASGRAGQSGRRAIPVHQSRLVRSGILRRHYRQPRHSDDHGTARRHRHFDGRRLPSRERQARLRERPRNRRHGADGGPALQREPRRQRPGDYGRIER